MRFFAGSVEAIPVVIDWSTNKGEQQLMLIMSSNECFFLLNICVYRVFALL